MNNNQNGLAIASLILGILSIILCCCGGIFGIILGALGILFALLSTAGQPMVTNAKWGLGLSIGGLVLSILMLVLYCGIMIFNNFQETEQQILPGYDSQEDFFDDYYDYGDDFFDDYKDSHEQFNEDLFQDL